MFIFHKRIANNFFTSKNIFTSYISSSSIILHNIPEPITKFNPKEKARSLQYQRELDEYQKNPDPEYVVVPKGSLFEENKVRDLMQSNATEKPERNKPKSYTHIMKHEYKFVDKIRIKAISGSGGDGCLSFDRQPSKPRGPPDGGNGGNGGDVIIRASTSKNSLYGLQPHHFRATNGQNGRKQKRNGKNGSTSIVEVPPGTIIRKIIYHQETYESDGWDEEDEGWQGLEEGIDINIDEYLRKQGKDPDSFADLPQDGEEFDGFKNSNIKVDPMEQVDRNEIAHLNAKAKKSAHGYVSESELDSDLDEEYAIDDSSGLEDSDSDYNDSADDKVVPADELNSNIESRIGKLMYDKKVTNKKQRLLTTSVLGDLSEEGKELIVAMGGKGAKGSQAYHWRASKTPGFEDKLKGGKCEEISLEIEMKMLANVGLVGYPNAGKSTFLRAISRATPKVAAYPFTTLRPRIGMIEYNNYNQVSVADLPGIIEGAHQNRGLGFTFLRHIERTSVLCFVISMSQLTGEPIKHFASLIEELEHYQPGITTSKKTILIANKMDIGNVAYKNYLELKEFLSENEGVLCPSMPIFPISAKEGTNLTPLLKEIYSKVHLKE